MSNISSKNIQNKRINKQKYRISNDAGLTVCFSNYGARITLIKYKGKELARNGYISGRCANRIKNGSFILNGKIYQLDQNEGNNHLHGGSLGFSKKLWEVKEFNENSIVFYLRSPDGDMGYPGNLDITVTYRVFLDGRLSIEYRATCDQDTILNPVNHLFIKSHEDDELWINAKAYTEKDSSNLPTGLILPLNKTIYDFSKAKHPKEGMTYDINYVLDTNGLNKAASLKTSDMCIDIYTDRPGLQLYKSEKHLCLEAQAFPDAVHFKQFPSPVIKKDTAFYSKTVYYFNCK